LASLDPAFHQEAINIHRVHEELIAQLGQLDAALDQIFCFAETFTDLSTANHAMNRGEWLAESLPSHYAYEETTRVLETIARMSPEPSSFASEMKCQHNEMRMRPEAFREPLAHLSESLHIENTVNESKKEGRKPSNCA
jgi:hypothetical protein